MTDMQAQVDLMEQVWSSIDELCSQLAPEDWDRETECPGWTVKDQLSHMVGNEAVMLGRPPEPPAADSAAYVKNPLGAANEAQVEARRPLPPDRVFAEWREVTGERLRLLRSLEDDGWNAAIAAPIGRASERDVLPLRIVDAWVHEQDMRRATGRPGHMQGDVARFCWQRMADAMPYVVGKRVAPPDGTVVFFNVSGGPAGTFAVVMQDGRGKKVDATQTPTTGLTVDFETFMCLCNGRWDAERALADGRVEITGDEELGRRVLAAMAVML